MKKFLLIIYSLLFGAIIQAQTPDSWQALKPLGITASTRVGAAGFSIGGKGYIGTGREGGYFYKKDFFEYDPAADVWTQKADFGGSGRYLATGFTIGNKGYIANGRTGENGNDTKNDVWAYDPVANTWEQKANFSGTARAAAIGFSIGSKAYIGLGIDISNDVKSDFFEYDPTPDTWIQKTNFGGEARIGATGFSIANKGYVGTGANAVGLKNDFWEYDPAADLWSKKANFGGAPRSGAIGFNIGTKGYIAMGAEINNYYRNDIYEYDPVTDSWKQKAFNTTIGLAFATGFSIGDKGYIGTGVGVGNGNDFITYTPASDTWSQKANLIGGKRSYAAGFNIGDKGYIGMGANKNDFWEYDPATNSWTQKADFGGRGRSGATCFSIGNKGYIGNGQDDFSFKNDFWEYDPAINAWTQKANFAGGERNSAAGFSIGGKGYIGTGYGNSDPYRYNDFWEYDPVSDKWTQKANFGGSTRGSAIAFSIAGKGYIGLGSDGYMGYTNDFWEYNPVTDTWTEKAGFTGVARDQATGFSIGARGFMGSGQYLENGLYHYTNDFWQYDPVADIWTQKANLGGELRAGATGFSIGGSGYLGFGIGIDGEKNDWWKYTPSEVLPLKLISFTAKHAGKTNKLQWHTAQEINSSHFEIERSSSDRLFTKIGVIKANGGSLQSSYDFTDLHPVKADNYYRLKIADKSGAFKYSEIKKLSNLSDLSVSIAPNPVKAGTLNYNINTENTGRIIITISDMKGKALFTKQFAADPGYLSKTINVAAFPAGVYILKVSNDNESKIVRFVKE